MMKKDRMTSRERVKATLACTEPDRVPRGYSGNPGITDRLEAHFNHGDHYDWGRYELKCDDRSLHTSYTGPRLHAEVPDRSVNPQWGIRTRWIEHGSGGYMDFCDFPLKDLDPDMLAAWPMPSPDDFDYDSIEAQCRNADDLALFVGGAGTGDIINSTGMLCTMEETLVGLISEDEGLLHFIDRRLDVHLVVLERTLERVGGRVDFMWLGEDLGTQRGPIISLDLYRKVLRPRHQRFVDLAKSYNLPVMIHTCGSSSWVYEDFIEMGINAVDTLQPEAVNMSPEYLKEHFGGRLAFHGCISTAEPLTNGTPEEVRENCCRTLDTLMPGGGYWFAPTHAIQDNTPTENVLAMYQAAEDFGWYS